MKSKIGVRRFWPSGFYGHNACGVTTTPERVVAVSTRGDGFSARSNNPDKSKHLRVNSDTDSRLPMRQGGDE